MGALLKVPFRLLHFPGVALAVVAAALLLTLATTSTKLFVASAGGEVLRQQLADAPTDPPLSITLFNSAVDPLSLHKIDDGIQRTVSQHAPALRRGGLTVLGVGMDVLRPGRHKAANVQLASRTGFLDHVRPLQRAGGEGVWLTDTTARELGVRAGQTVLVRSPRLPPVRTRVAGVYRDLAKEPPALYWGTLLPDIYPSPVTETEPPPLLLAAPETLGEIGKAIDLVARFEWDFYLPTGPLTLEDVEELAGGIQLVHAALSASVDFPNATITTPLPGFLANARDTQAALSAPVETISLSGRALALGLAAAVGFYMVRRRRSEFMVLAAQGIGARLGVRAVAEAVLPMALGGLAGWELALVLGRHFDPSPVVSATVVRAAGLQAGLTLGAGLLLIGVATLLVSRHETRERVGRVPGVLTWPLLWEALALLLARSAVAAGLPGESIGGTVEVWAKQDVDTLRRELRGFTVSSQQSASAAALLRTPSFLVVAWTLGMLEALGALAGLVTVAGLLLYVQARQRGQVLAYLCAGASHGAGQVDAPALERARAGRDAAARAGDRHAARLGRRGAGQQTARPRAAVPARAGPAPADAAVRPGPAGDPGGRLRGRRPRPVAGGPRQRGRGDAPCRIARRPAWASSRSTGLRQAR